MGALDDGDSSGDACRPCMRGGIRNLMMYDRNSVP